MKINSSLRTKSLLLVILFFLNTMVGFACSIGWDTVFKERVFQTKLILSESQHYALEEVADHHDEDSEDHCCKDEVEKFEKTDKLVSQSSNAGLSPVISSAFLSEYYYHDTLYPIIILPINRYQLLKHHPPIPDIRIARQSFQL